MNEQNMECFKVYKHTAPNNKLYIGVTQQENNKRWKGGSGYKYHHPHFYNAIKRYGWRNFKHEILVDNLTKEEAEELEIHFIKEYKSNDRQYGYNISNGGSLTGKHSKETKKKISDSKIGDKNPMYGLYGEKSHLSKKVRQYDFNGNVIKEWNCARDITRELGFNYKDISSCCRMKIKSSNGFQWRYASDNLDKVDKYSHKKKVNQYDKDSNFIKTWDSIRCACRELNIGTLGIINCCKKRNNYKTAGGFRWEYYDESY